MRVRQAFRTALRATVPAVALVAALTTGCTDDDSASAPEGTADDTSAGPDGGTGRPALSREPAPAQVRVHNVWGRWPGPDARRTEVLGRRAGRAVTGWMGAASSREALATFTPGARDQARADAAVMAHVVARRERVDAVPTRRQVRLVAYAPRGTAVGATASVQLVLLGLTSGGRRTETAVTGDLYLTRDGTGRWRVFGYELRRRSGEPGSFVRSLRRGERR